MEENKKEEKKTSRKIDPKEILDAWLTSMCPTDLERERAEARKKVCEGCENNGTFCKDCGCWLSKKIYSRVINACSLGKWNEVDVKYLHKIESVKKTNLV